MTIRTAAGTARNLISIAVLLTSSLTTPLAAPLVAQTTQTLNATPQTVVWGNYNGRAKPALTVHSGDTVVMQTLSTCGTPEAIMARGVPGR